MSRITQNPQELGAKKIKLDESFAFGCHACGMCCRGRTNSNSSTDIFLSGPDVNRMSEHLQLSFKDMINKYIVVYHDPDVELPVCRLRIRTDGSCRFLTKGKCSVYNARPRTCALYPLARSFIFQVSDNHIKHSHDEYLLNALEYECDYSQTQTVDEWLQRSGIPIEDLEDRNWYKLLIRLKMEAATTKMPQELFQKDAFRQLYLDDILA